MSVNSKMTALANEVREISGVTGKLGIDTMTSNLSEANDEVVSQSELIAQIAEALEGKAAGGSSGESFETCTVTYEFVFGWYGNPYDIYYCKNGVSQHEQRTGDYLTLASGSFEADVNSFVIFTNMDFEAGGLSQFSINGGEIIGRLTQYDAVIRLTSTNCDMSLH